VVVAYQPHLVSRTRLFGVAMGEALGAADEVVVLDVYLAREEADPAVTGALVADAVPLPGEQVAFVPDFDAVPAEVVRRSRPGDLVVTLGAGTVTQLGPRILALLAGRDG
jgi:UDP-N-acetylmuramate--alanine ligase